MLKFTRWLPLFLLPGCMVGPDYHRPILTIPETFHYLNEKLLVDEEALNLQWWDEFEDPVLSDLIVQALAYNWDVKIAAANIETALGLLIETQAPLFPQIGYDASFAKIKNSAAINVFTLPPDFPYAISAPRMQTTWQAMLTGSWNIDVWGRTRRLIESARAELYASVEARQGVILSLVASVANTYILLRSLDEQLAIAISTKLSYSESVEYFKAQFKYGQTSEMTVVQAETQYEIAAAKVPQLRAQIVRTENSLSVLIGSNPRSIPRGKSIKDLQLPLIPSELPSELLCRRPDIKRAEQQLIAANAQIGAAKALYFPSITLTGSYGSASSQLSNLFTGPARTWSFIGSIVGPIFTAGAIYGQVVQAEGQRDAALYNYAFTIQKAFADVEDALISNIELKEQLDAQGRLVKAAGEYQRLATLQYKGGYAPYFIVIQAQEQYFPAELSWVQTRADFLNSAVAIYQAMGGGWVDIAEEETYQTPEPLEDYGLVGSPQKKDSSERKNFSISGLLNDKNPSKNDGTEKSKGVMDSLKSSE